MTSGLDAYIEQEVAPLLAMDEFDALVHASIADTIQIGFDKRGITRPHVVQALLRAGSKIAGLIERRGDRLLLNPALRHWLAVRFEELPRERQTESLVHAAREFAARGDLVVAARLFRGADMEQEIDALALSGGSLLIWMTHGFSSVRELVDQAGDAVVARSPVLKLMRCIVLMKSGQISEAQQLFASVDKDDLCRDDDAERDREVVRAALSVYGCAPQRSDELDRFRIVVARSADVPDWKSLLSTLSCILDGQAARFDTAMASLIDARVHARNAKSHYNLLFLSLHEASILLAKGELKRARAALSEARKRWRRDFSDDQGAETVLSALTASLEYELGQLSSSRLSTRRSAYRMPDSEAWFDIYAAAYEPMARLAAMDHGLGPALEILADQRRKLIAQGLTRVAALLQNLGVVMAGEHWIRDADGATDRGWDEVVPSASAPTWQEQETFTLATAYSAMRVGRMDDAEEHLRRALDDADRRKLGRSGLRFRMALVSLLLQRGDARAKRELRLALTIGGATGARQLFQHAMGPALTVALSEVVTEDGGSDTSLARFVASFGTPRRSSSGAEAVDLSEREVEVLRALGDGGSDKIIGRMLGISEHGVRFHLKSVYRKFSVHNRVSAIHRGRELGVIIGT
jgi:LuxR family maltose regulon positive regulatory protein